MAREKFFSAWAKATSSNGDEHYVTVVGKFEQSRKEEIVQDVVPVETNPNTIVDGILTYGVKNLNRKLTLGVSICHPSDTFNEEIGITKCYSNFLILFNKSYIILRYIRQYFGIYDST